ncbi:MAG: 16S rRNA (guanine(966)-N(2))-methyltransferase RsmD [Rhizobacter sp.]|nr:16S rRNA (guanine(966)-N(2))-methyltransferase RsmD [Rhizobacter sp.]MBP6268953.1 16S rRNA (guanine(966)-N(2))-methyltransferase RsmD [Rhizobacter sp.]
MASIISKSVPKPKAAAKVAAKADPKASLRFGSRAYTEPPSVKKARKKAVGKPPVAPDTASLPREVRIIGGVWKRSKLPVSLLPGLRPTPDRVRETLFNWLGADLSGWRCLDAFGGSGALGFEAASRGAASVVMLEREQRQVRSLCESKLRLKADMLRIEATDALSWMRRCVPDSFELVFIDPPFGSDLLGPALAAAARLVVPQGYIYLEAAHAYSGEEVAPIGLTVHRHFRAGLVHAHLLQRAAADYTAAITA